MREFCTEDYILLLEEFVAIRPYLYHLTAPSNLDLIRETARMLPAAALMRRAERLDLLRKKRRGPMTITIEGHDVILRDQDPLHQGNILLTGGYAFEDLVQSLNERVFFWPGTDSTPISYGIRHFERYKDKQPVILRVPTLALIEANADVEPMYCGYNSGSPRCSNGQKSLRGPDTFLRAAQFPRRASQVVEVTLNSEIAIPSSAQFSYDPRGPWQQLWHGHVRIRD